MLNNIKSTYFLKEMISYIPENIKLNLFRYNKAMQNMLNINIINYKLFPGLIEVDELRKMRKYGFYDYVGEYLNGQKHGKAKEYYSYGGLKFEGEYLYGKRHGKAKEYYFNGKLKFEGEYLNGKKWNGKGYDRKKKKKVIYEIKEGNCKNVSEYCRDDKISFKGEYKNGRRDGRGEEYHCIRGVNNGKLKFRGSYLNGRRHGEGKRYDADDNLLFEGEYFYGNKWNGKGYNKNKNVEYEIKNGNAYVKKYFDCGRDLQFEGQYKYGKKKWNRKRI